MKRFFGWSVLALLVVVLAGSGTANAQGFMSGDDPLLVLPDVFVIIDTSGSMGSGWYPCGPLGVWNCNRRYATRQVLTGTYLSGVGTCGSSGVQAEDGILDAYKEHIRFGFATFDNDRCATSGNLTIWDYGDDDHSSKRLGIKNRGSFTGALVDLVDPADPQNYLSNNARAQTAACQTTAYNCTPLSAALYDARYYYNNWQSEIGYTDNLAACRPRFVLLMSDGAQYPSSGWYVSPIYQAALLFAQGIPVFVVGFGDPGLAGSLNNIALAGSGGLIPAFVAENPTQLFIAFSMVLDAILSGTTSRTDLVSSASHANFDESYQYAAYFEITLSGLGWKGHIVKIPVLGVDGDGDPIYGPGGDWLYFDEVLSSMNANSRNIFTVVSDPRSKNQHWTLGDPSFDTSHLPRMLDNGDPDNSMVEFKTGVVNNYLKPWMCLAGATSRTCVADANCDSGGGYMCHDGACQKCTAVDAGLCTAWDPGDYEGYSGDPAVVLDEMNMIRDWMRGVPGTPSYGDKYIVNYPFLGDVFHSNPVVVHPPSALTPNYKFESYFRRWYNRDTMLYVGANDGMLHAFVAEDNDNSGDVGREAWAFVPNNLLAKVQKTRMNHEKYVDGTPVVRDVYFSNIQSRDLDDNLMTASGNPIMGAYRTVLVGGQRGGGPAYFALDVTDPHNPGYLWEYRTDTHVSKSYKNTQCKGKVMQGWAEATVGQVWLKDEHASGADPDFVSRSVAIIPGGYIPSQALVEVTNCIDMAELMMGSGSLHVVDMETGTLLKRFLFSDSISQDIQDLLDEYYAAVAADPAQNWNKWGNWFAGAGWTCNEKRGQVSVPAVIPEELLNHCDIFEDDTVFRKTCCWVPSSTGSGACNPAGLTTCFYEYEKKKNVPGGLHIQLKTEGCALVPDSDDRGRFDLEIDDDLNIESVNATPSAYNTTMGEYITRMFVPTTNGRIWRVEMANALYNREGDEEAVTGDDRLIKEYNPGTRDYCWDVGRENGRCDFNETPMPWFDMVRDDGAASERRPIMVSPTIALNYSRELVLFFGTGMIDNLEWTNTEDYFYAVSETRTLGADDFFDPDPLGHVVDKHAFDNYTSERLYGKPLVAAGNVFFTTYIPVDNDCLPGWARMYGWRFDDFDSSENIIDGQTMADVGTPTAPVLAFTPGGATVMTQQGTTLQKVPVGDAIKPSSQVLHWAKVL